MKKLSVLLLLAQLTSSAFAMNWFRVNANVSFNNLVAQARVSNVYGRPIRCQGKAQGLLANNMVLVSVMDVVIPAGQFRTVYVKSNGMLPFVRAAANIRCVFF